MDNIDLVNPETWFWSYDQNTDRLKITVCVVEGASRVGHYYDGPTWYQSCHCEDLEKVGDHLPFSAKDFENYENFMFCLSDFNQRAADKILMALNATAIARFHKQSALSDKYFRATEFTKPLSVGEVVLMAPSFQVGGRSQEANFMIIDAGEANCYAMLISNESVKLDANSTLNVGSIIRVSNNRAVPMRCITKELIQTLNIA